MLVRAIVFLASDGEQLLKEFDDRLVLKQALTVLAKYRGHPDGILDGNPMNQRNNRLQQVCCIKMRSKRTL